MFSSCCMYTCVRALLLSHAEAPVEKNAQVYMFTACDHRQTVNEFESWLAQEMRRCRVGVHRMIHSYVCRFCCCCCGTSSNCSRDERARLTATQDDELESLEEAHEGVMPPPLSRKTSAWDRAMSRLTTLLHAAEPPILDTAAGNDPLPQCILSYRDRIQLLPMLPHSLQAQAWHLLYTTSEHGCSIKTLLQRAHGRGPTLVLVKDRQGHVFGAFAAESWRREPSLSFYGTGESLLLSTWPGGRYRAWRWSGANRHFQMAASDCVVFGSGGGHAGLWLGSSLAFGSTARCDTFDNEPLTEHNVAGGLEEPHRGDSAFEVLELQVWGFSER